MALSSVLPYLGFPTFAIGGIGPFVVETDLTAIITLQWAQRKQVGPLRKAMENVVFAELFKGYSSMALPECLV